MNGKRPQCCLEHQAVVIRAVLDVGAIRVDLGAEGVLQPLPAEIVPFGGERMLWEQS